MLAAALLLAAPGHAAADFAPGEVIVRFKQGTGPDERRTARARSGVAFDHVLLVPRAQVVRTRGRRVPATVRRLERDPRVLYAEPNVVMEYAAAPPPNDPRFGELWGLNNTGQTVEGRTGTPGVDLSILDAWDDNRGEGQVIAIADSGVAMQHPDLADNIWTNPDEVVNGVDDDDNQFVDDIHGWDFGHWDNEPEDADGHGTAVASAAAAVADNAAGIAGSAPGAQIMPLAVNGEDGDPLVEQVANSIVYAATEGADAINASNGTPVFVQLLDDAVDIANDLRVPVFASAMNNANDNDTAPEYPCALPQPNVVCVASIDNDGALSSFSNFGDTTVDVAAPGRSILNAALAWDVLFSDDFTEPLAGRWASVGTNNTWDITTDHFTSPPSALTDSPGGPYANNTNSLISPVQGVDLTARRLCRLHAFVRLETEEDNDGVIWGVRDSTGATTEMGSATGSSGEFALINSPLEAVEGRSGVRPFFTLQSNESVTDDGVYVDDVRIECRNHTWSEPSAYQFSNGTSLAAPYAAGVAALVSAAVPQADGLEVARAIKESTVPMASLAGKVETGGRVDAAAAIAEANDTTAPAVTLVTPPDGASLSDTTPAYAGDAGTAPGDLNTVTVKVYEGLDTSGPLEQTRNATPSGGTWSVEGSPPLAPGTYTAQAEQSDAAGNTGASDPHTFTIGDVGGVQIAPPFDASYSLTDLGPPPGVPPSLGGLTLKAGTTNRLLIGGEANEAPGALYEVGLIRDAEGHIIGFSSANATRFADAAFVDGGVTYGPGGVLFYARFGTLNPPELGQIKPGSSTTDKVIDLTPLGVAHSPGSVLFVPPGLPGEGSFKILSWPSGEWYDAAVAPDGNGTYNVQDVEQIADASVGGAPAGFVYVNPGSPLFGDPSLLVTEFHGDRVTAYTTDGNGDPVVASERPFVTGLNGALGAFIDPLTGDFLFSTFETTGRVIAVRGFAGALATLTVEKHVVNDDGGTASDGDFTLHVKQGGVDVTGSPRPGDEDGTEYSLPAGTYTVSEDPELGYAGSIGGDCAANGAITLAAGESKTCTVTNHDIAAADATLRVVKHVINDDGGTATPDDWTMHVDGAANSFPGAAAPGVARSIPAGDHTVSESGGPAGYAASFSGDCGSSGEISLQPGEDKTCTITNDDIAPTLRVIKRVVNNDGGIAVPGDWTMHIRAGVPLADVTGSPFAGAATPGVVRTLRAGTYVVGESGGPGGYAASLSGDCNGAGQVTLGLAQNKTCTITNDDVPVTPPPPPPPPPDARTCDGEAVTILGNAGNNAIEGAAGRDVILAGDGNDRIDGGGGPDLICAGDGNDRVNGGVGKDRVFGGDGRDKLSGAQSADRLFGEQGADRLSGGPARDRLTGGPGGDRLRGASGNDRLFGEEGGDALLGGLGADLMDGGPGPDSCAGGAGADRELRCE